MQDREILFYDIEVFRFALIGHPIMVEVKSAFGTSLYGDIKKFPRKK